MATQQREPETSVVVTEETPTVSLSLFCAYYNC